MWTPVLNIPFQTHVLLGFESSGKSWNLDAQICSHWDTRALVRSNNDVGWLVFFLECPKDEVLPNCYHKVTTFHNLQFRSHLFWRPCRVARSFLSESNDLHLSSSWPLGSHRAASRTRTTTSPSQPPSESTGRPFPVSLTVRQHTTDSFTLPSSSLFYQ